MRVPFPSQPTLDTIPIAEVPLNTQCRDEIIPILAALRHLYSQAAARDEIVALIAQDVNGSTSPSRGRPGLDYWQILVLAAVRLGCNLDYDKLQNLAEEHRTLRRILGIGSWQDDACGPFDWRRIRDNVCLVRPETLEKLNEIIVRLGHRLVPDAAEKVRGDTFVVETNIHYPTDANLLADGLRKILGIAAVLAVLVRAGGWRQQQHLQRRVKQLLRAINQACKSKRGGAAQRRKQAYQPLLKLTRQLLQRARRLLRAAEAWERQGLCPEQQVQGAGLRKELAHYVQLTEQALTQARRRVVLGESVPNAEKLFSIFEPHTELINRGKTPQPVEFGHKTLVLEDQEGFVVHYAVLGKGVQDKDVAVSALERAQEKVGGKIESASFDRAFHTPENQRSLAALIEHPCVPARGAKQEAAQQATATVEFRAGRRHHPGVESAIGALQAGNGLERCRDRSEPGYARYVGLGLLGRNLHVLGKVVLREEAGGCLASQSRRKPMPRSA